MTGLATRMYFGLAVAGLVLLSACETPSVGTAGFGYSASGTIVSFVDQSNPEPVSWSWDFASRGTSNDQNPSFDFEGPGTFTVELEATFPGGATASAERDITVTGNGPSDVTVTITPTVVSMEPGAAHSFTATVTGASDPSVTWTSTCGSLAPSGLTATYTAPGSEGACTVTVTSTEDADASASAIVTVTTSNTPPAIDSFIASPSSVTVGETVTFSWSVSDADGDTVACTLDVDGDSATDYTISDCAATTSQTHAFGTGGSFAASLAVSDGSGGKAEANVSVGVSVPNAEPVVSSFAASPSGAQVDEPITFSWSVNDADGDPLSCALDVDGDGVGDYAIGDCVVTTSHSHAYEASGSYAPSLTVSDGQGGEATANTSVAVDEPNSPPGVSSFSVSPESAPVGDVVSFSWSVNDADGDPLSCALDVDGDGVGDYAIGDCVVTTSHSHAYEASGSYAPSLTVSDGQGGEAVAEANASAYVDFVLIAGSYENAFALDRDGNAWAWGKDGNGELGNGDGSSTASLVPVPVEMPAGVVFTSIVGRQHALALDGEGSAWAWGFDYNGQLGDGEPALSKSTPTEVSMPLGVSFTQVSAAMFNSYAIDTSGDAWAWGYDGTGQLGDGDDDGRDVNEHQYSPTRVAMPQGIRFVQVASHSDHVLALDADGAAWAWGRNFSGELGIGSSGSSNYQETSPVPVVMPAGVTFVSVSVGDGFSLGLAQEGTVWAWGSDESGRLGDGGPNADQELPVLVQMPSGVTFTAISAGYEHSLALDSTGRVWAWGYDFWGQLGDGGLNLSQAAPVEVLFPEDVSISAISASYRQSFALDSKGRAWSWGDDSKGQLGDGEPLADQSVPVTVVMP